MGRTTPREDVPREIVGVVANVADGRPGTRQFPTMYVARGQLGSLTGATAVLVRTEGGIGLGPALRRSIQLIDPELPCNNNPNDARSRVWSHRAAAV